MATGWLRLMPIVDAAFVGRTCTRAVTEHAVAIYCCQ